MNKIKISDKKLKILHALGINTEEDLLAYYPFRYEHHVYVPVSDWNIKQKVCFEGVIKEKITTKMFGKNRCMQTTKVQVGHDTIAITIFNQRWFQQYKIGTTLTFFGVVQDEKNVVISSYNQIPLQMQLGITPKYNKKAGISEKDIIKYIKEAFKVVDIVDWIPQHYKQKYNLIDKKTALLNIHFPSDSLMLKQSIRYLKYEEFLKFQLAIQQINVLKDEKFKEAKILNNIEKVLHQIPFQLSVDQKTAVKDIRNDLSSNKSMYRLLQGDVGSGKTIVAFLAMLSVKTQTALLAPTEILARQHYENFKQYCDNVVLLVGSISQKEKNSLYQKIKQNEVQHIIGTHAIFQENVLFHDLGLVIIDEQQRFGVNQRKTLLSKGDNLDVLIMSATPIPRTLAMTVYNDSDISIIKTLPKTKKTIHSYVIPVNSVKPILSHIEQKIIDKEQVYVVCPSIEKNDNEIRNIEEVYNSFEVVSKGKYRVGMLHGKMSAEEKNIIMNKFINNDIQLLVSTTVIEVGVNVKNANTMVIYNADRFGLSQLHQLRGRCARGDKEGYCYFLTDSKEELALEKLKVLSETQDGFLIAEHDLKLRGPGDVLGIKQSGVPNFILGDVIDDKNIMSIAKQDAIALLSTIDDYPYIKNNILTHVDDYLD